MEVGSFQSLFQPHEYEKVTGRSGLFDCPEPPLYSPLSRHGPSHEMLNPSGGHSIVLVGVPDRAGIGKVESCSNMLQKNWCPVTQE